MNSIYYIVGLFFGLVHALFELPFFMHHMAKVCFQLKMLPYEWGDEQWEFFMSEFQPPEDME
jgi:hypothetical protein